MLKEIYDCSKSKLLWYNIFSTKLEGLGFEIKPYYRFVAKDVIEVTQYSIDWYVDDIKL